MGTLVMSTDAKRCFGRETVTPLGAKGSVCPAHALWIVGSRPATPWACRQTS